MELRVANVRKEFERFPALNDVSLDIRSGELIALLGPSGSGKTTLLRLIAGLERPSAGSIFFGDEDASHKSVQDRNIGFVFQHYALFRHMTVLDNITFGLRIRKSSRRPEKAEIRRRALELLDLVQLSGLEKRYPTQLSGGQRQRVALARAMAVEPNVLLLDEPFGALDAQTRVIMQQILTNLWQRLGISVLFVTHDIDEAIFLSDRIYVMTARPGTIKAEVTVPLARPRDAALQLSPEFIQLRADLGALIREESLKAMGGELNEDALKGLAVNLNGASLAQVV